MPSVRIIAGVIFVCGAAGALCSCGGGGWRLPSPSPRSDDLRADYNPFAPQALRIHPLTHVAPETEEGPALVCHIEMTDRWGDPVKGLGRLQVQLYRVMGGFDAGRAEQILRWDVHLEDEKYNASVYDTATRTYRVELVGLPDWVVTAATGGGAPLRLQLRAVLQTLGPTGEERVLSDDLLIDL